MNPGYTIFMLFMFASAAPVLVAVTVYHDNLSYLILPPSALETMQDLQITPEVTYTGYEVIDPNQSLRFFFEIHNPYNVSISITGVSMQSYCHEHETYIGTACGESLPLGIPPDENGTLSLLLEFTIEGKNDVLGHYNASEDLYLDLKSVNVVIQGVEASYSGEVLEVGPIPLG